MFYQILFFFSSSILDAITIQWIIDILISTLVKLFLFRKDQKTELIRVAFQMELSKISNLSERSLFY